MATRADVVELRVVSDGLAQMARNDVADLVASLDLSDPAAARDALLEAVPALTDTYGEIGATAAAEWYEELRASSPEARGRFRARPADLVPAEAVRETVRWSAGPLWEGDAATTAGRLTTAVDKYVRQPGRDTISRNAGRDRAKWARVPSGAETCAFCLMVASRGFVYRSEQTASKDASGEKYHGDCRCMPVPDWSRDPVLEGYDPKSMYEVYNAAVMATGENRFDTKGILAEMRRRGGVTDATV